MLLGIILAAIYLGIMELLESDYRKKIESNSNSSIRVKLRYRMRIIRISSYIILIIALFLISYVLNGSFYIPAINGTVAVLMYKFRRSSQAKPISSITIKSILESNKNFCFYLRGFNTDDYRNVNEINADKKRRFSELYFFQALNNYYEVFAIGKTREVESPFGAKRIYVDSSEWKQGVHELMNKSVYNFILINSRPSCLWEIEKSFEFIEKNIYIVDDYQEYLSVKKEISNIYFLPLFYKQICPFCFFFDNGKAKVISFSNDKYGCDQFIRKLMEGRFCCKRRLSYIENIIRFGVYLIFFILWLIFFTLLLFTFFKTKYDILISSFLYIIIVIIIEFNRSKKRNAWKHN